MRVVVTGGAGFLGRAIVQSPITSYISMTGSAVSSDAAMSSPHG